MLFKPLEQLLFSRVCSLFSYQYHYNFSVSVSCHFTLLQNHSLCEHSGCKFDYSILDLHHKSPASESRKDKSLIIDHLTSRTQIILRCRIFYTPHSFDIQIIIFEISGIYFLFIPFPNKRQSTYVVFMFCYHFSYFPD